MIKRLSWFIGGLATGAAGAGYAKRKVRRTAAQLAPVNVARRTVGRLGEGGRHVAEAIREGRQAARLREDELRARREARIHTLDDQLDDGDQLLVDGQPVDTARVIVLKQRR